MLSKLIIISIILPILYAQLYYPDEETGGLAQHLGQSGATAESIVPANINLTELRGTSLYEEYVDKIIATGILKLTLAVEKAIISSSPNSFDNVVFAPVGIAGKTWFMTFNL